jgi:hypothetical protein
MKIPAPKTELPSSIQLRRAFFQRFPMKRLLSLIAALCLLTWGTGVANANELLNANLDVTEVGQQDLATPTGWTVEAARFSSGPYGDGCSSEDFANILDPGGKGLFFKPFGGAVGDELSVLFYQDNPATPGTKYTLSGYAAAEANYCGFFATNSPAPRTQFFVEFLDAGANGLVTNVYSLTANGLSSFMTLFTTAQYTAPANTATVRAGVRMLNAYTTTGSQGFWVDAFDLESVAPPGSPDITTQPLQITASPGDTKSFTVGLSNPSGASYQWQFYGTNISNGGHISGATSATLTITGISTADVGHYRVRVSNSFGTVTSKDGTLAIVGINFYPVVTINGKINDTYRVDYSTALAPTTWIPLSTNKLTTVPQLVLDASSPGDNSRFYKAVFLY